MTSDLWKNLELPAELRQYMTLSGADVHSLTQEALQAADPKAKLQELLIAKGQAKRDKQQAYNQARMKEDLERISSPWLWPQTSLPVKTQPWVTNAEGRMRCGRIRMDSMLIVRTDDGGIAEYATLEELVKTWSVD
ncbi:hypothetical protein EV128_12589 [Rhizobium azibense]|nr:hypothetical protein EV128_12589 [Rhizobium azibense]